MVKGKTGDVADFDPDELRRLKAKIDERRAPRASVVREETESPEAEPRSIARLSDVRPDALALLSQLLDGQRPSSRPTVDVGQKIMLTLADAAALSSLSEHHLREAVKAGKLKAKIIGRGYKVKRADLDAYVRKL
jgi:excisionase family DNA binding protein